MYDNDIREMYDLKKTLRKKIMLVDQNQTIELDNEIKIKNIDCT